MSALSFSVKAAADNPPPFLLMPLLFDNEYSHSDDSVYFIAYYFGNLELHSTIIK